MCVCVCVCVCVSMCVLVCERESEKVCVCVCVLQFNVFHKYILYINIFINYFHNLKQVSFLINV